MLSYSSHFQSFVDTSTATFRSIRRRISNGNSINISNEGQIRPTTLIIIGISMQTLFIALVQGLLITTKQLSAAKAYTWLVGSLYGATFKDTFILGIVIIAIVPLLFLVIPKMKISILDDPVAIGLGLNVQRMKLIQLITSTILVSMAISLVGNIGFVGLIAHTLPKQSLEEVTLKKSY